MQPDTEFVYKAWTIERSFIAVLRHDNDEEALKMLLDYHGDKVAFATKDKKIFWRRRIGIASKFDYMETT